MSLTGERDLPALARTRFGSASRAAGNRTGGTVDGARKKGGAGDTHRDDRFRTSLARFSYPGLPDRPRELGQDSAPAHRPARQIRAPRSETRG